MIRDKCGCGTPELRRARLYYRGITEFQLSTIFYAAELSQTRDPWSRRNSTKS